MPKDLYIPPQAMEVFLEAFEGPLDLLLYLIRRQNLNILDIPLAEITRQYMKYIEVMTELQLELAGEYMVMAATLAEIKSRMLLPRPKVDPEGNEEDPRAELVRRLQEYERFKRAAESIDALPRLERDVWTTSADLKDRKVVRLLPTVTLQEMLIAFKDVVVRSEMFAHHHIQRERLSVRERMGDILTTLEHASFVEFIRLFRLEEGRMGVTVTFMALLELVREGLIEIVQAEAFAPSCMLLVVTTRWALRVVWPPRARWLLLARLPVRPLGVRWPLRALGARLLVRALGPRRPVRACQPLTARLPPSGRWLMSLLLLAKLLRVMSLLFGLACRRSMRTWRASRSQPSTLILSMTAKMIWMRGRWRGLMMLASLRLRGWRVGSLRMR
jgi:segregation and condensation protein A